MPVSPIERRACLAALAALALAAAPRQAQAAPPQADEAIEDPAEPPDQPEPESEPEPMPEPEVTVEREPRPTGAGVAGAFVDPDDPNATRAQSDLEGESLDTQAQGVPERLPKLQAAGWWTTFSAVALATSGGIFAGIAEVREDEAKRLAYSFDLSTGRTTTYGPVADDYERLLREGHTYQWVARGLIIAGGVALIAGVTLFAVDGAQRRRAKRSEGARVRLHPHAGGLGLRF